jgi:muconolactone delta-isomerase
MSSVLEPGKAYQLWLEMGGQKTSSGIFAVDEDGLGIMVFHTSVPIRTYESIEITTEPVVGSATPTTLPIVRRTF